MYKHLYVILVLREKYSNFLSRCYFTTENVDRDVMCVYRNAMSNYSNFMVLKVICLNGIYEVCISNIVRLSLTSHGNGCNLKSCLSYIALKD